MASVKDIEGVTDDLERLLEQMRTEIRNGPDFAKLIELVDEIGAHADDAAATFNTIDEALTSRLGEIKSGKSRSDSSQRETREKSTSSA